MPLLAHRPLNSNMNSGVPRFQILQPAAVSKLTVKPEVLRLSAALENIFALTDCNGLQVESSGS